jgi:hypothetical protein
MKRIFTREQYLSQYKKHYSVNEMIESDVNWGDSLVGRMINSVLRKAEIGYNLMRMKNIIALLKNRFETMHDDVQLSELPEIEKITIEVSIRLQTISKKIVSGSETKKIISLVIEAETELADYKEIEGVDVIIQKLGEYKTFLLDGVEVSDVADSLGVAPERLQLQAAEVGEESGDEKKTKEVGVDHQLGDGEKKPLEIGDGGSTEVSKKTEKGGRLPAPSEIKIEQIGEYVPKYKTHIEALKSEFQKVSEEAMKISPNLPDGYASKSNEYKSNFQKKFKSQSQKKINALALQLHPDVSEDKDKMANRMGRESVTALFHILENIKKKYFDVNALNELWSYVEKLTNLHNDIRKWENDLNTLCKNSPDKNSCDDEVDDEMKNKLQTNEKNFKNLSNYRKFYEKKVGIEITTEEMTSKFEEIFTEDIIAKFTITKEKATTLKKYERSGNLVMKNPDHIIEIVRLFKRAYRIHTTSVIQSGRTNGKVSNSVFREYENLGSGQGTPDNPGSGPWRNIKLYDAWENAVFDILADNKYKTTIFSDDCKFTFVSGDTTVESDKKLGKILLNFITKLLADSKMYTGSGALPTFLKEYFGLTVDLSDTAMTSNGKSDNDVNSSVIENIVKTKIRYENQRNLSKVMGGSDSVFEWMSKLKADTSSLPKGFSFRIKSNDSWFYFLVAHQTTQATYFYYLKRFAFDTVNIEIDEQYSRDALRLAVFFDGGKKLRYVNIDGKQVKEEDNISIDDVEILVDLHGKLFTKLKVKSPSVIKDFSSTTSMNLMNSINGSK